MFWSDLKIPKRREKKRKERKERKDEWRHETFACLSFFFFCCRSNVRLVVNFRKCRVFVLLRRSIEWETKRRMSSNESLNQKIFQRSEKTFPLFIFHQWFSFLYEKGSFCFFNCGKNIFLCRNKLLLIRRFFLFYSFFKTPDFLFSRFASIFFTVKKQNFDKTLFQFVCSKFEFEPREIPFSMLNAKASSQGWEIQNPGLKNTEKMNRWTFEEKCFLTSNRDLCHNKRWRWR